MEWLILFDWDNGNWPKCAKHGLSLEEIEASFAKRNRVFVMLNKETETESRYALIGRTQRDRYVFIVFTIRRKFGSIAIRPISARYMHEKEQRSHEKTQGISSF